jgi:hypothetical protein
MNPDTKKPARISPRRLHHPARSSILGIGVLLMLQAAAAAEFQCPKVRASKSRFPAYPTKPTAGVCEGFYDKDVSQGVIEIASLVVGKAASTLAEPTAAALLFRSPVAAPSSATLHVEPLRDVTLYRVDASFQQQLTWNTTTMIKETGLTLRDLGYLAIVKVGGKQDLVVLPLQLEASPEPAPLKAHITVKLFTTAEELRWRVSPLNPSTGGATDWTKANIRRVYAGSWLTFEVPLIQGGLSTVVDLRGDAVSRTSDKSKLEALPSLRIVIAGSDYVPD